MKNFLKYFLITTFLISFTLKGFAANYDAAGVINAYNQWCATIGTAKGDAEKIVKLYAPHAVLLPTLSDEILFNDKDGLNDYFTKLTSYKNIRCTTEKIYTEIHGEYFATTAGFYDFSYTDKNGKDVVIQARFTFVYKKINNEWLIIQHHSSFVPDLI